MDIQINTDTNIQGHEKLAAHVRGVVEDAVSRFAQRITRIEVHLTDQNAEKSGREDKRCLIEARLEGRHPTAVHHDAATLDEAVHGAAAKMERSIASTLERVEPRR